MLYHNLSVSTGNSLIVHCPSTQSCSLKKIVAIVSSCRARPLVLIKWFTRYLVTRCSTLLILPITLLYFTDTLILGPFAYRESHRRQCIFRRTILRFDIIDLVYFPPLSSWFPLLTVKNALKMREHAHTHTHLDGQQNVGKLEAVCLAWRTRRWRLAIFCGRRMRRVSKAEYSSHICLYQQKLKA